MDDDQEIHILIVDDSPEDRALYRRLLTDSPSEHYRFTEADTGEEGLDLYSEARPDCVLLDYQLPDIDGLDFLRELIDELSDITTPVIMLTGQGNERVAIEAMRRGAQDYLVKGQVGRELLERTIRYAIERQRLQTELRARARHQIELKNQFLSHVSHELRSPMTVVYQFVTLVLDGLAGPTSSVQREYLTTALWNVKQLQTMIDDLLEATRAESGKLSIDRECLELGPVIENVVTSLEAIAQAREVSLSHDVASDLPAVCADSGRVRQILMNLIENGIKFTPPGGSVRVRASCEPDEAEFVSIAVSDTGCGISQESQERIFDRLHQEETIIQASRKGLGLGLYICQELVARHGGHILVESEEGKGSTITVLLPIFSLARLIAPVVIEEGRVRHPIALVSVFAASPTSPLGDSIATEVANVVRSCMLPGLDVLLPRLHDSDALRGFFIVARTDADGADVLANRLRGRLQRSDVLTDVGVVTDVRASIVQVPSHAAAPVESDTLELAAAALERTIASALEAAPSRLRDAA